MCVCRDDNYCMNTFKQTTKEQQRNQKSSCKTNSVCISRLYVDEYSDHVEVQYVSAHTNHKLCTSELQHLPLPQSSMDEVALKISRGITTERIMEGLFNLIFTVYTMNNHNFCYQIFERGLGIKSTDIPLSKVSRKHFLSKQDIHNVKRSVLDRLIKRHENDAHFGTRIAK